MMQSLQDEINMISNDSSNDNHDDLLKMANEIDKDSD